MKHTSLLIFLFFTLTINAQKIIFVDLNNTSSVKNGLSWQTAFNDLQTALVSAISNTQVWVAKGAYYPTNNNNTDIAFIVNKGVKLYGSFEGTEKSIYGRKLDKNITILSGNIGNKSDSTDNSYNIIRCINCDSTTIIDGFQMEYGYAYNSDELEPFGGNRKSGSGIFIDGITQGINASPIIKNCKFYNNSAQSRGGAIYYFQNDKSNANIIIKNCSFENNKSFYGSGIYYHSASSFIQKSIVDSCSFEKNYARAEGASIYLYNENPNQTFQISNSSFKNNTAISEGGGIMGWFYVSTNYKSAFHLRNCLFDNNKANGGTSITLGSQLSVINPKLENIKFTNHKSRTINSFLMNWKDTATYNNCYFNKNNVLHSIAVSNLIISNSKFISNIDSLSQLVTAPFGGIQRSFSTVINSIFVNNTNLFKLIGTTKDSAKLTIKNSTFYNNNSILSSSGKGVFSFDPNNKNYIFSVANFKNCIFQKNNPINKNIFNGQTAIVLENCGIDLDSIENYLSKDKNNGKILIYGKDNIVNQYFIDTSSYKLYTCSPAINAGNNALSIGLLTDIDDKARFLHGKIDIGAYEFDEFDVSSYNTKPTICESKQGSFSPILTGNCINNPIITWRNDKNTSGTGGNNLGEGIYTFFVKDSNNCVDTVKNVKIDSKGIIGLSSATLKGVSKAGEKDGSIGILGLTSATPPIKYIWSTGDTTAQITKLGVGIYAVSVTDANGCFFSTSFQISIATSVFENKDNFTFQVLQNPVDDYLTLVFEGEKIDFYLFNQQGKLCVQQQNVQDKVKVDVANLAAGFYILQAKNSKGVVTNKKIIVQH
jgi:hypothetical protein